MGLRTGLCPGEKRHKAVVLDTVGVGGVYHRLHGPQGADTASCGALGRVLGHCEERKRCVGGGAPKQRAVTYADRTTVPAFFGRFGAGLSCFVMVPEFEGSEPNVLARWRGSFRR